MSSLDRLVELAKQTGDRLIVHNPIDGNDVVIMDVFEYEMLIDSNRGSRDVHGLSSSQMLDQINRDIAIWRADKDMEEDLLDEEYDVPFGQHSKAFFDPYKPTSESWHEAGDILGDRFGGMDWEDDEDEEDFDDDNFVSNNRFSDDFIVEDFSPETGWTPQKMEDDDFSPPTQPTEQTNFNNFEENRFNYTPTQSPMDVSPSSLEWEDESLSDDEPVFLEEPIQF